MAQNRPGQIFLVYLGLTRRPNSLRPVPNYPAVNYSLIEMNLPKELTRCNSELRQKAPSRDYADHFGAAGRWLEEAEEVGWEVKSR